MGAEEGEAEAGWGDPPTTATHRASYTPRQGGPVWWLLAWLPAVSPLPHLHVSSLPCVPPVAPPGVNDVVARGPFPLPVSLLPYAPVAPPGASNVVARGRFHLPVSLLPNAPVALPGVGDAAAHDPRIGRRTFPLPVSLLPFVRVAPQGAVALAAPGWRTRGNRAQWGGRLGVAVVVEFPLLPLPLPREVGSPHPLPSVVGVGVRVGVEAVSHHLPLPLLYFESAKPRAQGQPAVNALAPAALCGGVRAPPQHLPPP